MESQGEIIETESNLRAQMLTQIDLTCCFLLKYIVGNDPGFLGLAQGKMIAKEEHTAWQSDCWKPVYYLFGYFLSVDPVIAILCHRFDGLRVNHPREAFM